MKRYKEYEANGDIGQMIVASRELQYIMNDFEFSHEFKQHKDQYNGIMRQYEQIKDQYRKLLESSHDATAPAIAMPKGVSAPPALKKIADAEARKKWGANFVKSIFLTSKWTDFKNPKWPYQVSIRRMEVDFIVNEGSNHFVYHYVITEGISGGRGNGNYSVMDRQRHPIKEKVNYK